MRAILAVAVVAIVSALFMSCGPKEPDMTALKKTVDDFNSASKDVIMGGDYQKNLAFFDDNAVEMPPNMAMIKGKDALKAFWEQSMKSGMKMTSVEFNVLDVQASGTMAYSLGTYNMTMSAGKSGEMKDNGKFIDVWKQQADGAWKVIAETWNTDKPMPVVEKPKAKKSESKHKMTSKKGSSSKKAATKKSASKKKTTKKSGSKSK